MDTRPTTTEIGISGALRLPLIVAMTGHQWVMIL